MIKTRWYCGADIEQMLEIEYLSFTDPWDEDMMRENIQAAECLVIDDSGEILGYAIYQQKNKFIRLFSIAIHPSVTRKKFGTMLIDRLKELNMPIRAEVKEHNVDAQLFFKSLDFIAIDQKAKQYEKYPEELAIVFRWERGQLAREFT